MDATLEREHEKVNKSLIKQEHISTDVFARSSTEIVCSNPTRGMDDCVFACVGLCR
jgi:hypothetical protein